MDGTRLKGLLKKTKTRQRELAEYLDVTDAAVSHWARGGRDPSDDIKMKLAEFFGVSVDYLMGRDGDDYIKKEDPAEGIGEVGHEFDLRHNQADYLRKGECAGVCPEAQRPEEHHPAHDRDDPLRLTTIKTGRVYVLKVYRYSEVMTQGSDKVKPCAVEYVRASEFAECNPEKLRVIEQDIPYRLSVTADISSSGAETIVVNDDFDFVSGNIYLVSMSGLEMFYRVSSCPDGSYLLADDTGIQSLSPPAQAETGFRFVAVAERTIIRGGKLLRRK